MTAFQNEWNVPTSDSESVDVQSKTDDDDELSIGGKSSQSGGWSVAFMIPSWGGIYESHFHENWG